MSAEAVGWVYRHSPYTGATFAVHHAVADTVNDQNGNRFWMSQSKTSVKARTSRKSVNEALTRLEGDGFLLRLGKGPGDTVAFMFMFPDVPAVYDTREVSPEVTEGVTPRDTPRNVASQGMSRQVTQTQENPTEPKRARRDRRAHGSLPADDFASDDTHRAIAAEHGLDLGLELLKWIDHCRAKDERYIDHPAAFRTWLRRAVEYGRGGQRPVATLEQLAEPASGPSFVADHEQSRSVERVAQACPLGDEDCIDGYVDRVVDGRKTAVLHDHSSQVVSA